MRRSSSSSSMALEDARGRIKADSVTASTRGAGRKRRPSSSKPNSRKDRMICKLEPGVSSASVMAVGARPRSAIPFLRKQPQGSFEASLVLVDQEEEARIALQDAKRRSAPGGEDEDTPFVTKGTGVRKVAHLVRNIGRFVVTPQELDFGLVEARRTHTRTITIQYLGPGHGRFRLMPISNPEILVTFRRGTTRVASGMAQQVDVHWKPRSPGLLRDEIVVCTGERHQYRIPMRANVVSEIKREETPNAESETWVDWVPRLRGSYFNWKEQVMTCGRGMAFVLDENLTLEQVQARAAELEAAWRAERIPECCVRVDQDDRPWDTVEDRQVEARASLDQGISLFLSSGESRAN